MSQIITPIPLPYSPPPPPEDDEFPYGWRDVRRELPDGTVIWDQVPLTLEDRLFPEEGDQTLETPLHRRDCEYCHLSLQTRYENDPTVAVLCDLRIDFDVTGIRPMGPDVVVIFGVQVPMDPSLGTFSIARNGGHTVLAIELGSPSTRTNDIDRKPPLFYRIGIEKYVFVDRGPRGDAPAQLNCWRRGPQGWILMTPDAKGRYDLAPVNVLIGVENDHVWLYDATTGERILDHGETVQGMRSAEAKVKVEAQARADAEAKVKEEAQARADAEAKAREEAKARADAEAKVKEEAQARADAEAKVKEEAQARADAEAKAKDAEARARDEATRNAALEERLRELEAKLRSQDD